MAENSPSHCASEAARLLNSTWKNTKNAKLLRHPPVHPQPAWVNMVLGKSSNLVTDIASGLGTVPDMPEAEQLMAELLQWHVPDLIAAQLAWLGQRPDLLGLQCGSERQAAVDNGSGAYWLVWRKCLKFITILTQFVRRFHIHEQLGRRINADCAFNIAESLEKHGECAAEVSTKSATHSGACMAWIWLLLQRGMPSSCTRPSTAWACVTGLPTQLITAYQVQSLSDCPVPLLGLHVHMKTSAYYHAVRCCWTRSSELLLQDCCKAYQG